MIILNNLAAEISVVSKECANESAETDRYHGGLHSRTINVIPGYSLVINKNSKFSFAMTQLRLDVGFSPQSVGFYTDSLNMRFVVDEEL